MSNNWMIVLMGLSPFVLIFIWSFIDPMEREIRRAKKADEEWYKNDQENPPPPPTEEELQEWQNLFEQELAWQEHLAKNSPKEKFLRDWKA